MHREEGSVTIGGSSLEFAWYRPPKSNRPVILLLHEGLGCVGTWRDFPEHLAMRTGSPVLAYSRQGYGRSDPVPLPRPLTYMHDEAFEVVGRIIDRFQIERVVLCGHSDGASIATIYAGGVADGRVAGVILMAPHFFNEDLCVATIRKARHDYEQGDLRPRLERYHGANVDCAFYGWNDAWLDPRFMDWNIEEYLPQIAVPVLLIWGRDDPYGTMAQVRSAMEKCGGPLETAILDDCRHWPYRERTDETLSAIERFIDGTRQERFR